MHHRHFFHRIFEHHAAHHAARHGGRGHHGFFGFGADFGDSLPGGLGRGPGGFGPGRKLGATDLQLLLLALLAEKPSHGYELIKAMAERSNGYYTPSPGMVYPALTYLEELGHATVQVDGNKKLYSITEGGLAYLEQNRGAVDTLLEQLTWLGQKMDRMRQAMSGDEESDDPHGGEGFHGRGSHRGWSPELRLARRNLKLALLSKVGAAAEIQRKAAEILERVAAEIRAL
jgi:DNA-binding PadR family transcriptional regulator